MKRTNYMDSHEFSQRIPLIVVWERLWGAGVRLGVLESNSLATATFENETYYIPSGTVSEDILEMAEVYHKTGVNLFAERWDVVEDDDPNCDY